MKKLTRTAAALGMFALAAASISTTASAADIVFNANPFAGSTADPGDGVRAIFAGNQRSLPSFNVLTDRFVFDGNFFNVGASLSFDNSLTGGLAPSGLNVIVVQDTAPGFAAGTAANLIANTVTADGAGFFVYSNRGLGVNRLVYSTNLNLGTADLSVLARIETPNDLDAVAALPSFTAQNFALAPVPEPETWGMLLAGLATLGAMARRRHA